MIPVNFKQSNQLLTKPQEMKDDECGSLHVFIDHDSKSGECISLWRPSLKERLSILFYGCIWLGVLSGQTQPPVWLDGKKSIFIKPKGE